jgi:hypothetical protein
MLFPQSRTWTPRQRCVIVAGVAVAVLVVFSVLVYGYHRYRLATLTSGVEHVENLGFGFRRVTIAKRSRFGQLGHYPFLYYRDRLLCQIVAPLSISPSGNFAIYQDGRSGKLILFRRRDQKISELTTASIGPAYPFIWHEDENTVEAELGKENMSMLFPLK